ncbi:MAG: hypothetical protein PHY04_01150 [Candidatus ainarchaeum sp.]|jgi:hypothetical protein|nr:hypothetical protein [Candidatus ainarchaeum sp.]MDD3086186.1 hypothetical protein [Candidatus ainarchaeum sp.]MDD4128324.1 hypothetical protein [Candidatus ainarchaeum sp.]MDD4467783.1 hypothetical protein [Candidatus ainarchaeum sp.]HPM86078.1 hypothetical protein [archaeon]
MARMSDVEELKYEYEKALREKANLEKILERRRKLNLLGPGEEESLKDDIKDIDEVIRSLRGKYRSVESEHARARIISDSNEKAPWEN